MSNINFTTGCDPGVWSVYLLVGRWFINPTMVVGFPHAVHSFLPPKCRLPFFKWIIFEYITKPQSNKQTYFIPSICKFVDKNSLEHIQGLQKYVVILISTSVLEKPSSMCDTVCPSNIGQNMNRHDCQKILTLQKSNKVNTNQQNANWIIIKYQSKCIRHAHKLPHIFKILLQICSFTSTAKLAIWLMLFSTALWMDSRFPAFAPCPARTGSISEKWFTPQSYHKKTTKIKLKNAEISQEISLLSNMLTNPWVKVHTIISQCKQIDSGEKATLVGSQRQYQLKKKYQPKWINPLRVSLNKHFAKIQRAENNSSFSVCDSLWDKANLRPYCIFYSVFTTLLVNYFFYEMPFLHHL